jgi:glycosyltransferase involved in cell wall biosynthesis
MGKASPKAVVLSAVPITIKCFAVPQIRLLEELGFEVHCVSSDRSEAQYLRKLDLIFHPVEISRRIAPILDLIALIKLVLLFRKLQPTLIHTHTPKASFLGQLAGFIARVPIRVTTVHGLFFVNQSNPIKRSLFRFLEVASCRLSTRTICVSQEDIEYLVVHGYLPRKKMNWITVGVDMSRFDPNRLLPNKRLELRRHLGIPENAFVFGIVCRMVSEKGILELFEAMKVVSQISGTYLLHVGPVDMNRGDGLDPSLAEEYGISGACRFVGEQNDIENWYAVMDGFVLPSYREGFPVSVMEAHAMSLPSIVSDIRGCREAVVDGKTGLVVPPKEVGPLADAMQKLRCDPDLCFRLGDAAHERAKKFFAMENVLSELKGIYRDLYRCSMTHSADFWGRKTRQ